MHKQFHVPDGIYLLSHSIGCQPRGLQDYLDKHLLQPWQRLGGNAWDGWLDQLVSFRSAVAQVINCDADDICPQTNVSSALTKIIQSLPKREGRNKIVLTNLDFPSVGFVIDQMRRLGFELEFLPHDSDVTSPDNWKAALKDDVHLVLATHVFSNTGELAPVLQITKRARELGVISVVDVAQSVGAVPIDVLNWQADFVVGSCIKYLCGGPGAGFLYVNPATLKDCQPLDVGWFSHESPFEFDIRNFRYANDAMRFFGGTPSVAPFITADYSISRLLSIGIEKIHAHNQQLVRMLLSSVPSPNPSYRPDKEHGNTVAFIPNNLGGVEQLFQEQNVRFDIRENAIRMSVHIYNSVDEIQKVSEILQSAKLAQNA